MSLYHHCLPAAYFYVSVSDVSYVWRILWF